MIARDCAAALLAAAFVSATFVAGSAHAADGIKPLVGGALTAGGEKLVTVRFTDGSSQTVRSGGLVHLFGGFEYQTGGFALQANVGYHVDNTTAKNGDVKFARVPVELLGFWSVSDEWRVGGGIRKATGAKLSSSGAAASLGDVDLESKVGPVLQAEYLIAEGRASVYGRYVAEDYKVGGATVSGKHIGIGVSYRF